MKNYITKISEFMKGLGVSEFFNGIYGKRFLVFLEILLIPVFFLQPQLYYDPNAPTFLMHFYADSLTICGFLWAVLVFLTVKPFRLPEKTGAVLAGLLPFIFPLVCFFWLEAYNHEQFWNPIFGVPVKYQILNLLIYYLLYILLLLVCNSTRTAAVWMMILVACFGFLNYQLTVFRSMSFIASDIYSLSTALSVANTYQVDIDVDTAEFFLLSLVILAVLFRIPKRRFLSGKKRAAYALICAGLALGFGRVYVYSSFLEDIGVDFRVYRPQYKYRFYGTLLTTTRTFGYLHVQMPEGYSEEKVDEIISRVPEDTDEQDDNQTKQPNIIVIMNESFADLKELGELQVTEDYMPYYRSLTENTIKGYTYTSIFGGNTANSEFEFLTGNTMGFLPDNSVPYQLFLRDEIAGLTQTLKAQGYENPLALHPYFKTGYSRYKIYPLMGFEKFITSEEFDLFTRTVNYHITDQEDYKEIIRRYEANQSTDLPFYMFNVTMQNHGSYDGNLYETGGRVRLKGSLANQAKANQYLNMLRMSDEALKYLIRYFEKADEPTVIVFFGDHMPDLDEDFYSSLLGTSIDQLEGEELEKLYKIPFMIWANYDIEEQRDVITSDNYLSTYLADVTGMKRSGYQRYLTALREQIPCINALGYIGKDGKYYELSDESSPYYELIREYRYLEYNNLFGKENQRTDFFFYDIKN